MASIIFIPNPQNFSITKVAQGGIFDSFQLNELLPLLPQSKPKALPRVKLHNKSGSCDRAKPDVCNHKL